MKKLQQVLFFRREAYGTFHDSVPVEVNSVRTVKGLGPFVEALAEMVDGTTVLAGVFDGGAWIPEKRWDQDEQRYERMVAEWR